MIKKMVDRFVDFMIRNGAEEEDREVYAYGLQCVANEVVIDVALMACAVLLERVWEMAVWIVVFNVLRVNTGGYHASTPLSCFMCSTMIGVVCVLVYPIFNGRVALMCLACIFCLVVPFKISPVLHVNHPVPENKKKISRIWAVSTVAVLSAAAFAVVRSHPAAASVIVTGMVSVCLMALAGYLFNPK